MFQKKSNASNVGLYKSRSKFTKQNLSSIPLRVSGIYPFLISSARTLYTVLTDIEHLSIYSDQGKLLQTVEILPNKSIPISLYIDQDVSKLYFEYSGENWKGDNDPRDLAFNLSNYYIEPIY